MDRVAPTPMLPPVLYEDDQFIAFDKPAGLLTAPDRWDKQRDNLMRRVHEHLAPDCFNVHRLDRETSGVLLCAKTRAALTAACRLLARRQARKEYLALVRGAPPQPAGLIEQPLAPDLRRPGRMKPAARGKPAATRYEIKEAWRHYALVQAEPLTGRTHQVRVHLAALGCPIVGDAFYGAGDALRLSRLKPGYKSKGAERPLLDRLGLHAAALAFTHPFTDLEITIRAPWPDDFNLAAKYLRRFDA